MKRKPCIFAFISRQRRSVVSVSVLARTWRVGNKFPTPQDLRPRTCTFSIPGNSPIVGPSRTIFEGTVDFYNRRAVPGGTPAFLKGPSDQTIHHAVSASARAGSPTTTTDDESPSVSAPYSLDPLKPRPNEAGLRPQNSLLALATSFAITNLSTASP